MKQKILALILAIVMVVGLLPLNAFAAASDESMLVQQLNALKESEPEKAETSAASATGLTGKPVSSVGAELKEGADALENPAVTTYAATDSVRVLVVLKTPALLEQGYAKSELTSAPAKRAAKSLESVQDAVVEKIDAAVAAVDATAQVELNYHYTTLLNGVSVEMPYGALEDVRAMSEVATAVVVPCYSLPEDMSGQTASPAMVATKDTFGSAQTWQAGYTGAGMRTAIIDTGLDTDHPSFADSPAQPSLTEAEIATVLTSLNAYERYSQKNSVKLRASNLYRTEKVAYGFNYVDNDLDITHDNDSQGDHGTHVAGITAANKTEGTDVVGVAPDAQLIIMKVFGKNGGAYFDDIVAALEDCFYLNVDAVNMSLGSPAGFSSSREGDELDLLSDYVYSQVEEHDMIVAIAAGNSYSAAYGNALGTNLDYASNPDNSIISSPATYASATAVASIENAYMLNYYIQVGESKLAYTDVAETSILTMQGQWEYVMIPGYGESADFDGLDLYGKIAVISRGGLAFTDKQTNAMYAGASAVIVYDNIEDDLLNMEDAGYLPNIFVSKESGAILAAAADENGCGTLTVTGEMMEVVSSTAGQMSDFSSWGVGADLTLLPDVTAPGGNIYSTITDGKYGVMSGTSMATPHITGLSALVLEYLHKSYPDEDEVWYRTVAEALIMSTAEPVEETEGVAYSPRKQGAGAANAYSAVSSAAYLTVNGSSPKVSFGDDAEKTGVYSFSFEINNLTDKAQTYRLDGSALTDQVKIIDGVKYLGETSRALSGSFSFHVRDNDIAPYDYNGDGSFNRDDVQAFLDDVNGDGAKDGFDLNGDGKTDTADVQLLYTELTTPSAGTQTQSVTLPAGGSVTVTVQLTLSDSDKAYMDVNYENGIYVDGFVRCYAEDGTDLSLPFLGFYGDWSAAPIFDDDAWFYLDEPNPSRYWNVLWTADGSWTLGDNPYVSESYDESHNVLSPDGDGYQDAVTNLYLGMLRNAKKLTFTWKDEDGNVLLQTQSDYIRKSYYYSSYGICYPFLYDGGDGTSPYFDFLDEDGNCAYEDLSRFTLTVEGWLDDGDDICDDSFVVPMIIDTTAPSLDLDSLCYVSDAAEGVERQIGFTVSDNYDIAAVVTLTTAGSIIETIPVNTKKDGVDGESQFITLDVSKYDSDFYVAVCDYGFNESYYQISFEGENNVDPDAFYGYRNVSVLLVNNYYYATTGYNGWHSFTDPSSLLMHTSTLDNGETAVNAAEYVDGYVIGVDANNDIFTMKNGQWSRNVIASAADYPQVLDMAYDFTSNTMYVLTDEADYGMGGHLLTMDILTGELTDLGAITGFEGYNAQPLTLACDNDGILYTIDHASGDLYTIDPETLAGTCVGPTGYAPQYTQSMTVDHATNELYWASYAGIYNTTGSGFFCLDKQTGEILSRTPIEYSSEITGLYKPNLDCDDVIPAAEDTVLMGISLSAQSLSMASGTTSVLAASPAPYYAELGELTWSSSDEQIATVSDGVVSAISAGKATITAKAANGAQASCTIEVIPVDADLVSFDAGGELVWRSYEANAPASAETVQNAIEPYGSYDYFISAAYAGGTIYAYDTAGGFYRIDAETMQGVRLAINSTVNGTNGAMLALAYNYADGYLYGIAVTYVGWDSTYQLVRVNPSNGDYIALSTFDIYEEGSVGNLAIDPEGNFYSIVSLTDSDTWETIYKIYSFRLENDTITNRNHTDLADYASDSTSFTALVYSYENECLFWTDHYGRLLWVEPETGRTIVLGSIGSSVADYPMNLALVELPENEKAANAATPEKLGLQESIRLLEGSSVSVNVAVEPWNGVAELSYSIADSAVATVDAMGVVTGIKQGETTLTVKDAKSGLSVSATVNVVPSAGNLYGNVIYDNGYGGNYWISMPDNAPEDVTVLSDFSTSGLAVFAGAYYNDCIYAFCHAENDSLEYKYYLLKIDLADGNSFVNLGQVHEIVYDMAFDYTTGTMYAVVTDGSANSLLAQIDLETVAVTKLGDMGDHFVTLTVDAEGQLYAITISGDLHKVDKHSGKTTLVGATGVKQADTYQSMHYDYTTGNTYWSQIATNGTDGLYLVDLATGSATNLGSVYGIGASIGALYTVSEQAPAIPASVEPEGIDLEAKQTVVAGSSISLRADVLPRSVAKVDDTLTWTSSDADIASVDAKGTVTGHKAGVVTITATTANGHSASCTFTVTESERRFYVYDETNGQWLSFTPDDTLNTKVERVDAEDEARITASLYHDGNLYSFTADGRFWSLDPDTFERTLIGDGCKDQKFILSTTDWWGNPIESELDLMPLSMTCDEVTGKTYVQMGAYESYEDWWSGELMKSFTVMVVAEIDLATGEYNIVFSSENCSTNAIVVVDGRIHFVDTFESGMLSVVDLNDEEPEREQCALVYNYWGNIDAGRGMLTDPLTGVTYIIRDMTDWGGAPSSLCTINLSDADIETFGTIGADGAVMNSLFLR